MAPHCQMLRALLSSLQILVTIPLIIGHFFKIQGYRITDQTEKNQILGKLEVEHSTLLHNKKPYGFIYGKWFFGYITNHAKGKNNQQILYLLLAKKSFEYIKKEIEYLIKA